MSSARISFAEALDGLVNADDLEGIVGVVENHKVWGAFNVRIPSYILVNLVDAVRKAKEQARGDLPEPSDFGEAE